MFWKLEIFAFMILFIASATVFANGCMDAEAPPTQRFDLLDGTTHGLIEELAKENHSTISQDEIQNAEYIVMEEMRFNVTLADIRQ